MDGSCRCRVMSPGKRDSSHRTTSATMGATVAYVMHCASVVSWARPTSRKAWAAFKASVLIVAVSAARCLLLRPPLSAVAEAAFGCSISSIASSFSLSLSVCLSLSVSLSLALSLSYLFFRLLPHTRRTALSLFLSAGLWGRRATLYGVVAFVGLSEERTDDWAGSEFLSCKDSSVSLPHTLSLSNSPESLLDLWSAGRSEFFKRGGALFWSHTLSTRGLGLNRLFL